MTHNLKNSDFDEDQKPEKTSLLMTHGDPNLENIDFDAFYDMALSEDDEARELAFLLAHVPPRNVTPPHNVTRAFSSTPAVSASTTAISLQIRIQTPPSSPTPARQRSGPSDLVPPPYLSPELPQVPSTPNRSPVVKTHHSPAPPRLILSDEAAFWVVTSGAHPGIYHGRAAASAALGDHNPRRAVKIGSRAQAEHEFTTRYMEGEIVVVYTD